MISIFDNDGERLPITWQGYDFNSPFDDYETFNGAEQEGCFVDAITFSSPVNYQSEVATEITKSGGGIEYYNPRITSRVMNIRARLQAANLYKLHSHLNHIQKLFSPFYLQTRWNFWPPYAGRPFWADPWSSLYQGLQFTNLEDGTYLGGGVRGGAGDLGALNTGHYPSGKMSLQYSVTPLQLPDPPVAAIGQGWGADLDLAFLILDGGIAIDTQQWYREGNGTLNADWANIPLYPKISFDMTGAGAANLTVANTTTHPYVDDTSLVLDVSGLSNGDHVDIYPRDRVIWVEGVVDNTIYVSGAYPVLAPYPYTNTIAWSNTSNVTTNRVTMYEALSA